MIHQIAAAAGRDVSRETFQKLERYVDLLVTENGHQNLIGRSSVPQVWGRHIIDSAQLLRFASPAGTWLDIGSGAGLPGLVVAILTGEPTCLVEPRRLRVEFLRNCATELRLENVSVSGGKVESLHGCFDVVTARAVAPIDTLFAIAGHLTHRRTTWILPKGRSGAKELAEAQSSWQGRFRTEPSLTAEDAVIVVAEGVAPKGRTRGMG
jgi:16S rRNA (guanine527-N7)-methyltransferase